MDSNQGLELDLAVGSEPRSQLPRTWGASLKWNLTILWELAPGQGQPLGYSKQENPWRTGAPERKGRAGSKGFTDCLEWAGNDFLVSMSPLHC